MCKNATKTAASLMSAIEPTLINLLTLLGIANTPDGQSAIAAYDAALKAVENWVPGTTAQDVVETINAFTQIFNMLPIPSDAKMLADLISAGLITVIGVLTANAPAPTTHAQGHEEVQAAHVALVAHDTATAVEALVPGFKRSIFTSPSKQYENTWNRAVENADPKYSALKIQ